MKQKYKDIIDDIGCCPVSLVDAAEALEAGDCLSIGIKVKRPEAAVTDPSRVIVEDIFPTYVSTESFLESAKYKLESDGPDSIGGFMPTGGNKPPPGQPQMP